jgi:hypothetical protein
MRPRPAGLSTSTQPRPEDLRRFAVLAVTTDGFSQLKKKGDLVFRPLAPETQDSQVQHVTYFPGDLVKGEPDGKPEFPVGGFTSTNLRSASQEIALGLRWACRSH